MAGVWGLWVSSLGVRGQGWSLHRDAHRLRLDERFEEGLHSWRMDLCITEV